MQKDYPDLASILHEIMKEAISKGICQNEKITWFNSKCMQEKGCACPTRENSAASV